MRSRMRPLLVARTWLTAVMVLVAGIPQVACACVFCGAGAATPACSPVACCCGHTKAGNKEQQRAPGKSGRCCCCAAAEEVPAAAGAHASGGEIKRPVCTTTSAPRAIFVRASGHAQQSPDTGTPLTLAIPAAATLLILVGQADRLDRHTSLPPPTDLVVALQHFLI